MKNKIDYDYIIKQAESCLQGNATAFSNLCDYVKRLEKEEAKEAANALFRKGQELPIIKRAWKVVDYEASFKGKFYNVAVGENSYVGACNSYQVFLMKPELFDRVSKGIIAIEEKDEFLSNVWNRNIGSLECEVEVDTEELLIHLSTVDKKDKTPKPFIINVEDEKIGFNPFYLMDAVKFTKATKFNFVDPVTPVVFIGTDTMCMLCPVRVK